MPLNGIFPDWMLPVTTGDAISQVVNQGDLVLQTQAIEVEVFQTPVDIALPDDVQVVTIETAPEITVETTPVEVTFSPANDIVVERCTD
jgi:hypothetical protein